MSKFNIDNILKIESINSELELEQASSVLNKLNLLVKKDSEINPLIVHLSDLIELYESEHWLNEEEVTDEQLQASDRAEELVKFQNRFIQKRKELIKKALKNMGIIQNDLATILGHRKNYMSELINGVRPFSQEDIIIIHRILGIEFNDLINPIVKEKSVVRIRRISKKLDNPQLKLKGEDLNLEVA